MSSNAAEPTPESLTEAEVEYDPHKERVVAAPVSNLGTLLHFLKGSIGTGILAMPRGFLYTGLIFGTIATFITGALCSYGLNLLISTEYLLCKRRRVPYMSYAPAMEYAMTEGPPQLRCLAKTAGIIVNVFLISYQLGICIVYIIFVSKNVKYIIDDYHCDAIDLRVLMTVFFVLFLLINYVPNLKIFAPLSGAANVVMLFGFGAILYYVFRDFPPSLADHSMTGDYSKWIMFVGICLFAIESVGVVVSAEYSMKNPQDFGGFTGILNISLMIVTFMYWFLGFFGYARYKDEIESVITLNVQRGEILGEITQLCFSVAIVISFGLQCYPAIEIIWNEYVNPHFPGMSKKKDLLLQYVLRTLLVLFTYTMAMAFGDFLSNVIGFIGVACLSMLGFTFPGVMHACLMYSVGYGRFRWILCKDIMLSVLGVFLLLIGVYLNIQDMVNAGPAVADCPVNMNRTNAE